MEKSKELIKQSEEIKVFEARQVGQVTDKDRALQGEKKQSWDKNMRAFWLVRHLLGMYYYIFCNDF